MLTIHPKNSSESGNNATLGKFVSNYKGLELTNSTLRYPGKSTYTNGDVCPKGTPDSGKPGVVIVYSWPNFTSKSGAETPGDPQNLLFAERPADHHGVRAGQRHHPQAAGRRHHEPDHRRRGRSDDLDHRSDGDHGSDCDHTADVDLDHLADDHYGTDRHDDDEAWRIERVRAVVLVGGEGTRLRPLTLTAPKQMLPIVEQAMVERVLGHLASHGIDEAVLSLGYRPDAFSDAYPDGVIAGVRSTYAVEPTPLDTAGAIRFAAAFGGIDDTFVVLNGDVLTDFDISDLVSFHRRTRCRGHHRPHTGRRPEQLRCRAHRCRREGHRLHREAPA